MDGGRKREEYRECLRNHAARLGVYTVDGCSGYTPDSARRADHLLCVACGCHLNFHRKVLVNSSLSIAGDAPAVAVEESTEGRRRSRTKFTAEQKVKMASFAEKIGWRLKRREEDDGDEVAEFCKKIGVTRVRLRCGCTTTKNSSYGAGTATASSTSTAGADSGDGEHAEADGNAD